MRKKSKKNKGFTLIELLAVIVILAVIALIAVPQVLSILSKARKSAAEDSVYGIVKAAETYATEFMLTNNGNMPSEDLEFVCSKENNGCKLTTTLTGYNLTDLDALNFKGTKPTSGTITIKNNGKTISTSNLVINDFTCTYENDVAKCSEGGEDNNPVQAKLCKRATTLHTETCSQTDTSNYCSGDGYASGTIITDGNLGIDGTLTTGDAFDCDVNGDGKYDSATERFYYVADSNNGITTDSNVAVLVYYNNVSGGSPSNSAAYAYDSSGTNNNGPVTAITQLPTTEQWSNVSLTSTTRQITSETGGTTTSAGNLPTAFSYEGYAARLLTYQEVNTGCYDGTTEITSRKGLSNKCKFLMENTKYSNGSLKTNSGWVESPFSSDSNRARAVSGYSRIIGGDDVKIVSIYGVRPAIEVLKSNISY